MKLIKDLGTIYPNSNSTSKRRYGIYECPKCFKHFQVQTANVKAGKSKMCRPCSASICNITHGLKNHKLYIVWSNMKSRCYNKNNSHYSCYGQEGIIVCNEWINDFKSFYDWAILNNWNENLRIDKDILCNQLNISPKIYSPETCQFVSQETNSQCTRILNSVNKSGYRGVSWHRQHCKFVTQISVSSKKIHIGYSKTAKEAALLYDNYIINNNLKHTRNFNEFNL